MILFIRFIRFILVEKCNIWGIAWVSNELLMLLNWGQKLFSLPSIDFNSSCGLSWGWMLGRCALFCHNLNACFILAVSFSVSSVFWIANFTSWYYSFKSILSGKYCPTCLKLLLFQNSELFYVSLLVLMHSQVILLAHKHLAFS